MTEKYAKDNVEVYEIWNWYKRSLAANDIATLPPRYWHYAHFVNGILIPKAVRKLFRERTDLFDRFDDPFSTGEGSYFEWVLSEAPELLEARG